MRGEEPTAAANVVWSGRPALQFVPSATLRTPFTRPAHVCAVPDCARVAHSTRVLIWCIWCDVLAQYSRIEQNRLKSFAHRTASLRPRHKAHGSFMKQKHLRKVQGTVHYSTSKASASSTVRNASFTLWHMRRRVSSQLLALNRRLHWAPTQLTVDCRVLFTILNYKMRLLECSYRAGSI